MSKIIDWDMPGLVEVDDENNEVPPINMKPKGEEICAHASSRADHPKALRKGSVLVGNLKGEQHFLIEKLTRMGKLSTLAT